MINYYCPGFMEAQPIYKDLFELKKYHPECFYDNVNIKKIYGNFPNMIWNGGTVWFGPQYTGSQIMEYFMWYSEQNITLQLICTNPILEEQDLYDRYCNMVLDIASQFDFIEILVSSPILEEYIRNKYPHIKIDKSIIGTTSFLNSEMDNINEYIDLLNRYNVIVLPKKYSKDFDFLNQFPHSIRSRIEILATDPCPRDCPYIYKHYQDYGKVQLNLQPSSTANYCYGVTNKNPFRQWNNRDQQYTYEELTKTLEPMGFSEIKLSGRTNATHIGLYILPFLIKPEFLADVYDIILTPHGIDIMSPSF